MTQFVASSLNISNEDFLNRRDIFAGGNGAVINRGEISAEKVALIGKKVLNTGTITSPNGYVVMAAGDRVVLGQPGSDVVVELDSIDVADAGPVDIGDVVNEGTVDASDGVIVLAAGDVFSKAINLGTLSASGGTVMAKAARVGQFGTVNVDGIEGDGGNVNLTASETVALGGDSVTTANGGVNGDGGEVIVYSPDTAIFRDGARVEAKGGSKSGDGGFFELSGKEYVEVEGQIDLSAANGENGQFLIDPYDITIVNQTPDVEDGGMTGNQWDPAGDSSQLDIDILEGFLDSSDVTISTEGDGLGTTQAGNVIFNAHDDLEDGVGGGSGNSLTVNADGAIRFKSGSGINFTGAGAGVELNADAGNGSIALDADIFANKVTLNGTVIAHGSSNRTIKAPNIDGQSGKLTVTGNITKRDKGKLILAGGDGGINLSGNVTGLLTNNVILDGAVNANGIGDQTFDARTGTLTAEGNISKTNGSLTLAGASVALKGEVTADENLNLNSNTTVANGKMLSAGNDLHAASTLTGDGALTVKANNNITLDDNVAAAGKLILNAGEDVTAHGDITTTNGGSIEISSSNNTTKVDGDINSDNDIFLNNTAVVGGNVVALNNVTLNGELTLNSTSVMPQDVKAVTGTLLAEKDITRTTPGTISLYGVGGIDLNGTVDAQGGDLIIADEFTAGADLLAYASVRLLDNGVFDGGDEAQPVDQEVYAEFGGVYADGTLTKTGAGNLTIDVGLGYEDPTKYSFDYVYCPGENFRIKLHDDVVVEAGDLNIGRVNVYDKGINGAYRTGEDSFVAGGDLIASGNVNLTNGNGVFNGVQQVWVEEVPPYYNKNVSGHFEYEAEDQLVEAQNGTLTAEGWLWKVRPGNLKLRGNTEGGTDAVDLQANPEPGSEPDFAAGVCAGNLIIKAESGDIQVAGKLTTFAECCGVDNGLKTVAAPEIPFEGTGGVSVITNNGTIYTRDGVNDDTLNVTIEGYSDQSLGVDLPYGDGKAAIVVMSSKDLKLGPESGLIARGQYDSSSVDDRPGVDFLVDGADSIPPGRDPGEPIDVAVYLASTGQDGANNEGDVHVGTEKVYAASGGTMVVDAYNTVTLADLTKLQGYSVDRLEVCSRITGWLQDAVDNGTLPGADDPAFAPAWVRGGPESYILRGENPTVGTGEWILENWVPPPPEPKPEPAPEEPEPAPEEPAHLDAMAYFEDRPPFEVADECPALMAWAAEELGLEGGIQSYLTGAYVYTTDLQPCEICARLRDAATILADTDGTQIAALGRVISEFLTPAAPISEEQMASISQALALHTGDGTHYAAAGQWMDALVEYIGILNTEIGWSMADSVVFVTGKYVEPTTAGADATVVAYIEARLAALGG